jgi:hypothetical protein
VLEGGPDKRYRVSVTALRSAISAVGGNGWEVSSELGVGTRGTPSTWQSEDDNNLMYERIKHCWEWLEALTVRTVGEARFKEIFGRLIDWEESDRLKYIVSERE